MHRVPFDAICISASTSSKHLRSQPERVAGCHLRAEVSMHVAFRAYFPPKYDSDGLIQSNLVCPSIYHWTCHALRAPNIPNADYLLLFPLIKQRMTAAIQGMNNATGVFFLLRCLSEEGSNSIKTNYSLIFFLSPLNLKVLKMIHVLPAGVKNHKAPQRPDHP